MSWISPSFGDEEYSLPPPKKKLETTIETVTGIHLQEEKETSSDWLVKYKPKNISELAVHVKKVKEIENWLIKSEQFSTNKLLLLAGPSGCGKTTTIETVCKHLGYRILEWVTPVDKFEACDSSLVFDIEKSHSKQFEEYLTRSSRYSSCLDFKMVKTVIIVKDFPNIFLLKPSTFHDILENISKKSLNNPVVFICGESSLCRKLFSSKMKCQLPIIRFNPITNLQMLKVLKAIILQEKKVNKDIQMLCDKTLSMISALSKGDIRSAISELFFRCVKPSVQRGSSQSHTPEKSKDSRIDFFHGLTKVLSPKKIKRKEDYMFTSTPETIVDNFLEESKDFVNRLNESFYTKLTNISDLSNAAQRLATSDILLSRWQDKDIFHEYALSTAVRGVMVSNTSPLEPTFQFYGKQRSCHLENNQSSMQLEGKTLFSDLCGVDYQCLCDILPYAKYLLTDLNPFQQDYLKKFYF